MYEVREARTTRASSTWISSGFNYDIAAAMIEKIVFNNSRPDHKPENRAAAGGKAF